MLDLLALYALVMVLVFGSLWVCLKVSDD